MVQRILEMEGKAYVSGLAVCVGSPEFLGVPLRAELGTVLHIQFFW